MISVHRCVWLLSLLGLLLSAQGSSAQTESLTGPRYDIPSDAPSLQAPQLPPWPGQAWPDVPPTSPGPDPYLLDSQINQPQTPYLIGRQPPAGAVRPLPEIVPPGAPIAPPGPGPLTPPASDSLTAPLPQDYFVPPPTPEMFPPNEPVKPPPKMWGGSVELGLNGTDGNSESFNMYVGGNLERIRPQDKWTVDLDFLNNSTGGVTTANRYVLESRYEWLVHDGSPWEFFAHGLLELDDFKAFDQRISSDIGIGYNLINNEVQQLTPRLGAGVSREIGGPDDSWVPEASFGFGYDLTISDRQKINVEANYYPSWDDFNDYRLKSRADWEILLDEATNLSLKFGVIDTYDSTPNGARHNDVDYTAVVLWKF